MRLTKQLNYSKLIKCPVQMAPTMNTIKEKNSGKIRRFEANAFNSCAEEALWGGEQPPAP